MTFQPGDRVRWQLNNDGFPMVRYGFVGGTIGDESHVIVMFDDDLKSDTAVACNQLELVSITSIELLLHGVDLLSDEALRRGLVGLWEAEADQAGLEVKSVDYLGHQVWGNSSDGCALAELRSGGEHYILRALANGNDTVRVRADLPRPGET